MQWQFLLGTFAMGMVCHYCATIGNFCLASLQWLNHTKQSEHTKNQKKQKNKKMTRPNSLGVCNLGFFWFACFFFFCSFCFFLFFGFLFFWFLVFWFVVGCLKGWQSNTKVKDLGLTLCQFSHFRSCKRTFGWFYCLRWACGSIWKPCKKNNGNI